MSTLKTGKVKTTTIADELDTESTAVTNVINGSAKAWVNFNGTGTVAIRGSFNVSSITDNSTGVYTVNFTNAMPDVNYSVIGSGREIASGNRDFQPLPDIINTVSAVRICTVIWSTVAVADSQYIYVAVFS
jgi:hypothetical protein